jgi:RNA polymerase sigma factor (sigma-70 family)
MHARRDIERLYLAYGASVFRRALSILGNKHDAEEAMHDVFARVIDVGDQFRGDSHVMTWLYSATTNLCLNRLRDRRRRSALAQEHFVPVQAVSAPGHADRSAILRELIARMPEELSAVCVYHYLDEMTHEEIADMLGCSRRHVGNLLERARAWAVKEAS